MEVAWKLKSCGVDKKRRKPAGKRVVHIFCYVVLIISLYINDSCKGNPKRDATFYSFCWGDVMTTLGLSNIENTMMFLFGRALDVRNGRHSNKVRTTKQPEGLSSS